jgi:transcriptional regulator with XRE-family HTH domain
MQAAMPKTIHRHEYAVLLRLLKEHRKRAGLTQVQCSDALGRPQSFMSDVERGTRRLDVVQLRDLCRVFKTDLVAFVKAFERELR